VLCFFFFQYLVPGEGSLSLSIRNLSTHCNEALRQTAMYGVEEWQVNDIISNLESLPSQMIHGKLPKYVTGTETWI
jgi:hypothetical protein